MAREGWFGRFCLVAGGAAGGLMLVEACSEPVGEMLVDAGTAMMDAGKPGLDAGSNGKDGGLLSDAGDLLSDAGRLMQDAGMALMDAGSNIKDGGSDALAQPASLTAKSGTRIQMRATARNGADGSVQPGYVAPYDTQRDEPCLIALASDGKMRCLPTATGIPGNSTAYFSDSACTQPVFAASDAVCPPKYVYGLETVSASCGNTSGSAYRFYAIGAKHSGNYYVKSGTACTSTAQTAGLVWYARGAEIPSSSFVEFTDAAPMTL